MNTIISHTNPVQIRQLDSESQTHICCEMTLLFLGEICAYTFSFQLSLHLMLIFVRCDGNVRSILHVNNASPTFALMHTATHKHRLTYIDLIGKSSERSAEQP